MLPHSPFTTLFLDVGGVILSNGWDHKLREKAASTFHLDLVEFNQRHALTFDTYEIGKISLDEYLERAVFYTTRDFTPRRFKEFMFAESYAFPAMLQLIRDLKRERSIRVVAVSNEGRELMENRIEKFQLKEVIDFFVCSGFVGLRKPDLAIYRMALDLSQTKPQEVIYIDDRAMLAEIGQKLGFQAIQHTNFEQTAQVLVSLFPNNS